MIQVVVVDDEERIRLGLVKLIERLDPDYKVVGAYGSGQELLSVLGTFPIDVILTDIKMPKIDGLQLIDLVQQRMPKIKFAILSGFSDFAFAKKALRQGVEDYLLKPVNKAELTELLTRLKNTIELERLRKTIAVSEHIRFLMSNDSEQLPDLMVQSAIRELGQTLLFSHNYTVMVLHTDPELKTERLEYFLSNWTEPWRIVTWEPRQFIIVLAVKDDSLQTSIEHARRLAERVPHLLGMRIGISCVHLGVLSLRKAYLEAMMAMQQAWYENGDKAIQDAEHLVNHETEMLSIEQLRHLDKEFRPALQLLDATKGQEALIKWMEKVGASMTPWDSLYSSCAAVIGFILSERGGIPQVEVEQEHEAMNLEPKRFTTWKAFKTFFLEMTEQQLYLSKKTRQGSRAIEVIRSYIQQHFTEDLDLSRLAEIVYLTPSYLSKLFKLECGETITDYIISFRMEKAKMMLQTEVDLKTYQIGEQVGYPDPAYFNKLFKKVVSVTPKEYRERVRL
ncbi:response regulator [Paenibacillus sp. OV219]|uniref:response regulator n=1 Tax=Paenibacillus sp. OV219 TaxID=1884377 RepID=UPI0008D6A269|nr:response regulator [Paenibacillus sp. OV219]SEM53193.1 two-component system, response regulator YesN [Paenibacillus sp. OV219]